MFNSDGEKIGKIFQVPDFAGAPRQPHLTALPNGDYWIGWEAQGNMDHDIFAKRYPGAPQVHPLKPFRVIHPATDQTFSQCRIQFLWQKASPLRLNYPWEIEYQLYLSPDSNFSQVQIVNVVADTQVSIQDLRPGTLYYWKILAVNAAGEQRWSENINIFLISTHATPVVTRASSIPATLALEPNYPNPFNHQTVISYGLAEAGQVSLRIFDLQGRIVHQLVDAYQAAGKYVLTWNGLDFRSENLAAGIYYYQLQVRTSKHPQFRQIRKMCLLK